jgi:Domain of unknown function (DUF4136)
MKFLTLALLTISTAVAQKVTVEFDQAADFGHYRTFALRDARLNSRNPSLNSELIRKQLDDSIAHNLAARGLTEVTGPADLNVSYHLGSARKTEIERYPAGWRGLGTRRVRIAYTEGTLVIDLRDTAMKSLVWRSIAREDKNDPYKIAGKLDEMVKKSIAKYPPKPHANLLHYSVACFERNLAHSTLYSS